MKMHEEHPRRVVRGFLSSNQCKELEFIHKSCCAVGYRSNVFSTTLSHLIATNSSHLIIPFVPIRERLRELVEEYFDCEFQLCIEFTGLISWIKGSSIGWHSDDNQPYLKQRDFAAVCYLNNYGRDFEGGLFHFLDGEPNTVIPVAGDVVIYTADKRNIHSVDEIKRGERVTLTLWFTRDGSHNEDPKLISLISRLLPRDIDYSCDTCLPSPASYHMYTLPWPGEASVFNICLERIHVLGYLLHSTEDKQHFQGLDYVPEMAELFMGPVKLVMKNDQISHKMEFANILHALQVVQFYEWKGVDSGECEATTAFTSEAEMEKELEQREAVEHNNEEDGRGVFGTLDGSRHVCLSHKSLPTLVDAWEAYTIKLHTHLLHCLPFWISHQLLSSHN